MSILISVRKSVLVTDNIPDGEYLGVLYRMVQLGTQMESFKGKEKPVRKILLSWVIPSAYRMINDTYQPVHVHKKYTESLWETAHLRKDLVAMLGRDTFSEMIESQDSYELENLLGLTCMLTTTQKSYGTDNKSFAEITGFRAMPDDEVLPDDAETQSLTIADFNWDVFGSLTRRLRETIQKSPEFMAMSEDIRTAKLLEIENRPRFTTQDDQSTNVTGLSDTPPANPKAQENDGDLPF